MTDDIRPEPTPDPKPVDPTLAGLDPGDLLDLAKAPTAAQAGRFVPPTPEEMDRLIPDYTFLALIGQGGMGAVYKAVQKRLDRIVAVKVLPPELAKEAGFTQRFEREAKALARLSHPNLVAVHDFGLSGEWCYLVMEFVDGANLREVMRTGRLTPPEALAIVPQICSALQYAHDQGVVHRDIKPENILLDQRGRVRIADFGLAKLRQDPDNAGQTLTLSGSVLGTVHYMAPEQVEGCKDVDHRADIYSLGVVFYETRVSARRLPSFEAPWPSTAIPSCSYGWAISMPPCQRPLMLIPS